MRIIDYRRLSPAFAGELKAAHYLCENLAAAAECIRNSAAEIRETCALSDI